MSIMRNVFNGNVKIKKTKENENDDEWIVKDLFEGGQKLPALDNIGSSLTTLWSDCGLNAPVTTSEDSLTHTDGMSHDPNHRYIFISPPPL